MSDLRTERFSQTSDSNASQRALRMKLTGLFYRYFAIVLGAAALAWFLIRVVPKPSRATYPCQRAAFPIASAFVIWLTGMVAATLAYKHSKILMLRRHYKMALAALAIAGACGWAAFIHIPAAESQAAYKVPDPVNDPMGVAQGINPGRVVWVRDADATDWNGTTGQWDDPGNTDPAVVDEMVSKAVRWLTNETTDAAAWDALFKYRNMKRGKGNVGYQPDEKIAIKLNLTLTNVNGSGADEDGDHVYNQQYVGPAHEMVISVLDQLVNKAGVPANMIYIGDPTCVFPTQLMNSLTAAGFGQVHFMTGRKPWGSNPDDLPGREMIQFANGNAEDGQLHEMNWSNRVADGYTQDYMPLYYANAEYFINFAIHKAHGAAVTLCGKNHYGSMVRWPTTSGYYNMHDSIPSAVPAMGSYRHMVDLLGHKDTGGKNLIYILDGLWTGYGWGMTSPPKKWRMDPMNNDWLSSVMVSQDPVAIDSVGYDMWYEEGMVSWNYFPFTNPDNPGKEHWPQLAGGDDYLHEAAKANLADSGIQYDPEQDGSILPSLGVHEHWNNPADRQYTRNLGTGDGIELITSEPSPVVGRYVFYNNSSFDLVSDDDAIAPDKVPLFPGQTAAFVNYTSYDKGLNGLMIDIRNLPAGTPGTGAFAFSMGNTSLPEGWAAAPWPVITVRRGEGVDGSDRVVFTWDDGAIARQWLRVKLLVSAETGVNFEEVFYFGNAVGECGNASGDAVVDATDEVACRNNVRHFMNPATIDCPWDYNRDGKVNATDEIIARMNTTTFTTALRMLQP